MRHVLYLHGSFSSKNFGDFLLFYLSYHHIRRTVGNAELELCTSPLNSSYSRYDFRIKDCAWNSFLRADFAVCTGGGYFGEPSGRLKKWHAAYALRHVLPLYYLKITKKPYIITGVDAGDISNAFLRCVTRRIFDAAESVAVRNQESADFLKKIGVKKPISVVSDMVMSHEMDSLDMHPDESGDFLIHLPVNASKHEKLDRLLDGIADFIEGADRKVKIISDNAGQDAAAQYIAQRLCGIHDCEVVAYNDPFELLKVIADSDMIITSKLHVGICGIRYGKKVISISNHPKIKRFYHQLGLDEFCVELDSIDRETALNMLKNAAHSYPAGSIDDALELGDRNFTAISEFIKAQAHQ